MVGSRKMQWGFVFACAAMSIALNAFASVNRLSGHLLSPGALVGAKAYSPKSTSISLSVRLPMRHAEELDRLLEQLYNPADPMFQKYITPQEFTARYGATSEDYSRVEDYFAGMGCSVTTRHLNRLLLGVNCPLTEIQKRLGVKISHWLTAQNEVIRTIDTEPAIPEGLPIEAIHGLTSVPRHHPRILHPQISNLQGSGPGGGFAPNDIKAAYNLKNVTQDGTGQTLALFELDGYQASDVTKYETQFGLPKMTLQNVLIDGFDGSAGQGAIEVTLDIELMIALAPKTTKIIVYEGPNSDSGLIDVYQKIADDNIAKQISTSWGIPEKQPSSAILNSESQIFKQMAAQGQSLFAASGDSGAYDDGQTISVDDPSSQPYVTGVGGTTLTVNSDFTYQKETTWNNGMNRGASGGGISTIWSIPSYQQGVISSKSGGSTTMRNSPDVSLNADPNTGYAVYSGGQWQTVGGTSCAAPLWAAFTALVNQQRAANSLGSLGFANPALYQVGKGPNYAIDFHDIADGSTNLYYPAVTGYDLATGWGSFVGANLLADLAVAVSPSPTPSSSPSASPSASPTSTPTTSPSASPSPSHSPSPVPSQTASPSPSPSGSPNPTVGCSTKANGTPPATGAQTAGAALTFSLPFVVGFMATPMGRRRKNYLSFNKKE